MLMKIIIISLGFNDYTIQLVNALSEHHTMFFIFPDNCLTPEQKSRIKIGVKTIFVNLPRMRYPTNILLMNRIRKMCLQINPDVIHFQGGYPWYVFLLPFLKKFKLVTTIHDVTAHIGEDSLRTRWSTLLVRRFSKVIIVHGIKLKEEFLANYGYSKNIWVIPHGNLNIYPKTELVKEQKNWILFFGRIYEYKGLKYLIKAEPLIRKEINDFRIVIAGRGENFKKYEKLMKNRKNFIIFNEYVPESKMVELFSKSSLVVLPYVEASQSGVIPVAYQFKKPVISTDVGALSDVVLNGKTGLLIRPKDTKKLAEAIISLLKRPSLRKKMGLTGHKFANTELSWEKIALKTIEAYRS